MYITTGYDWVEPTAQELKTVHDLINSIFPIEEEKKLYLSILSTGILGETLQKFILANGCGGNGKGTKTPEPSEWQGAQFFGSKHPQ